jgi:hypothetical protein
VDGTGSGPGSVGGGGCGISGVELLSSATRSRLDS